MNFHFSQWNFISTRTLSLRLHKQLTKSPLLHCNDDFSRNKVRCNYPCTKFILYDISQTCKIKLLLWPILPYSLLRSLPRILVQETCCQLPYLTQIGLLFFYPGISLHIYSLVVLHLSNLYKTYRGFPYWCPVDCDKYS